MNKQLLIRMISIIMCMTLVVTLLTGCDEALHSKEKMIKLVTNTYNCEFVDVKTDSEKFESIGSDEDIVKETQIYTFKTDDFEFQAMNHYYEPDGITFFDYEQTTSINYLQKVLEFKEKDIEQLFKKHNIIISEKEDGHISELYKVCFETDGIYAFYRVPSGEDEWINDLSLSFYIKKYEHIETVYNFLTEFRKEMEPYLTKNEYFYCPSIHLSIDYLVENEVVDKEWPRYYGFDTIGTQNFSNNDFFRDIKLTELQYI